jgi:hypothetical protein
MYASKSWILENQTKRLKHIRLKRSSKPVKRVFTFLLLPNCDPLLNKTTEPLIFEWTALL